MPHTVLIADTDPSALMGAARVASELGCLVTTVSSFEEAKKRLALAPPDLLIADVRLGAYNGLHLAIRARAEHPDLVAIITHTVPDPVLEREAAAQGAVYFIKPISVEGLLSIMAELLAGRASQEGTATPRRWPRKRIGAGVVAMCGRERARIVDLSYGGLQLELAQTVALLPTPLVVKLPDIGLALSARHVWSKRAGPAGPFLCGLEVAEIDQSTATNWGGFVDSSY
jgi:DNA-binding response OmpR family regulator